jgi:hypothetical protein
VHGGEKPDIGPSGLQNTDRPYLTTVLDIPLGAIDQWQLDRTIREVDGYILDIITERKWADTRESYASILEELKSNLGLHHNLDPYRTLELLTHGIRLLKLQKKHRRREEEIQREITRLNDKP